MIQTDLIAPLGELIRRRASEQPAKLAYQDPYTSVSYGELADSTAKLAGHLRDLGLASGDRVAMLLPNSVEWVESCLAINRAGMVSVPISYSSTAAETDYRLADAECRAIIVTDECAGLVEGLRARLPALQTMILVDRGDSRAAGPRYSDLRRSAATAQPLDSTDIDSTAFIIYTSGTTGRAKGVRLTVRSMLWVNAACWAPIAGLNAADTVLSPLPLFHSYALNLSVLSILATGASEYIMEKYSPTEVLRLLKTGQYTVLPGVPTMFQYLLEVTKTESSVTAPGLRLCLSAGAIMPGPVNRAFEERLGVKLLDGYGITETATMVTLNWPHGGRVMGSCGLPLPGLAVRIIDPASDRDVDPGVEGEIIVRGPNVMQGYHNKPEETAKALRDGWYHTGDLAKSDENGFLTITGRLKELIIRGGQNIAPAEIEEAAMAYPGVLDCAAVGVPHPHLGEVPVLFIAQVAGAQVDCGKLLQHCRATLSSYKVPEVVHVVDEIPRTGSGKIIRFRLRDSVVKGAQAASEA